MRQIEKARRDQQIALARLTGRSEKEVATRYGVSIRTVRRALSDHRNSRSLRDATEAWGEFWLYVQRIEMLINDLALAMPAAKTTKQRVSILAAKGRLLNKHYEALRSVGFIPSTTLLEERKALREEHGAQFYQWFRRKLGKQGEAIAPWLGKTIEEWIETGDQGPLSRERDSFRLESGLWRDWADQPERDYRADYRAPSEGGQEAA